MPNGGDTKDWSKLSWAEWKGRMGARVEALETNDEKLFELVGKHDRSIAFMAGRAAAFGALGGGLVGLILLIIKMLWSVKGGGG